MRIMITGRKTTTEPTPGITPSTRRLVSSPAGSRAAAASWSQANPPAIQSWGILPTTKVRAYIATISPRKMGIPRNRCVSTASMRSVGVRPWRSFRTMTSAIRPRAKPKRRSAMSVAQSAPRWASRKRVLASSCCRMACRAWLAVACSRASVAPSRSRRASHRAGRCSASRSSRLTSSASRLTSNSRSSP